MSSTSQRMSSKKQAKKPALNMTEESLQEYVQKDYEKQVSRIKSNDLLIKSDKALTDSATASSAQTQEQYMKVALLEAEKLFANVRGAYISNPDKYHALADDEKIDMFKKEYSAFYDEFPIVCRYMVCMIQYSRKAFLKYLKKCKSSTDAYNIAVASGNKYEKGRVEDNWVKLQADYVRYLWEDVQDGRRFTRQESNSIWEQTYTALKKEFQGFRELYDNVESNVQVNEKKYKKELAAEMLERIKNKDQTLGEEDSKFLLTMLKDKLYKQRYKKTLLELKSSVEMTAPVSMGRGKNQEAQIEHDEELKQKEIKQKIKMRA